MANLQRDLIAITAPLNRIKGKVYEMVLPLFVVENGKITSCTFTPTPAQQKILDECDELIAWNQKKVLERHGQL